MGFLGLVLALLFIFVFSSGRRFVAVKGKKKVWFKKSKKTELWIFANITRIEAYKAFRINGCALILLIFLAVQIYIGCGKTSYIVPRELRYRSYMIELQGAYGQEQYDWLMEKQEEFSPLMEAEAKLQSGQISGEEYMLAMQHYADLAQEYSVYRKVAFGNVPYVMRVSGAKLLYDTGYELLFRAQEKDDVLETLCAGIVLTLCLSDIIAMKKSSGLLRLMKTTPDGHGKTARSKFMVAGFVSFLTALFSFVPRYWHVVRDFGIRGFFYPASSLTYFEKIPVLVSIFLIALFCLLIRSLACYMIVVLIMAISSFSGKAVLTIAVSAIAFCAPALLSSLVPEIKYLSVYPMFHVSNYIGQGENPLILLVNILLFGIFAYLGMTAVQNTYQE